MIRSIKMLLVTASVFLLLSSAYSGITLNAARIGAEDVETLAAFYTSAFGLKEVSRLECPGMLEIMMNFGDSVEAAKANPNAQIVIMHRSSDDIADPVPHMVLNVTDMKAVAEAIKAAGGSMDGEPRPFGNSGMVIGFATDPAGNHLELIQPATTD